MIKVFERVELGLENLQVITFPYKYVKFLAIDKIKRSIYKFEFDMPRNTQTAKIFAIRLAPEANSNKFHDINFMDSSVKPFERLYHNNDICYVELFYTDDTSEKFNIHWYGDSLENNTAQSSYINEKGELSILCKKNTCAEHYFLEMTDEEEF